MATKSQRFKDEVIQATRGTKPARHPASTGRSKRVKGPGHNLSAHAARTAAVAYEESATKPSRKSTRKSSLHLRAASHLERTQQLKRARPETRARSDKARAVRVRGKKK